MGSPLMMESIWFDRVQVENAECRYYTHLANQHAGLSVQGSASSSLVNEIARARENIQTSLHAGVGLKVGVGVEGQAVDVRINALEKENETLKKVTTDLQALVTKLQARVEALEKSSGAIPTPAPLPQTPAPSQKKGEDEVDESDSSDDDDDLFGSDEESDRKAAELKQKLKEATEAKKKAKKPVIAKSNIILDVKPYGDETDMNDLRDKVKAITMDGLLWGTAKFVEVAYGIKKLQIACVVEDDKVSVDDLEEQITMFEDIVQSVDVAAFNKV